MKQARAHSRLLLIFLCLMTSALFLGCSVRADLTLTTGQARSAIAPEEVKIYETAAKVPGKYEEVGIISASGNYDRTNLADMYDAMRREAAKYGANGIILGEVKEPELGDKIVHSMSGFGGKRAGQATAIYIFPGKQ